MKPQVSFALPRTAAVAFLAIALTALPLSGCTSENPSSGQGGNPPSEEGSKADKGDTANSPSPDSPSVDSSKNRDLDPSSVPADALISPEELSRLLNSENPPFVLDIRNQGQFARGYIDEAKNIPAGRQLDMRFDEIPKDREIVIASTKDERVAEVRQTLIDGSISDANIKVLDGGMDAWKAAGLPMKEKEIRGC